MDNKIYSIFYENYFKIDYFFVYIFERKRVENHFLFYLKEVVYFAYSIKMLLIFV